MHGYEALNRLLVGAGVGTVFQFMAEDTMALAADLETNWADAVTAIHARHEQGAVGMADGYARASDRLGVVIVGRGPGIAQTGAALVNARRFGSTLLLIVAAPALSAVRDDKAFEQTMFLRSTAGAVESVGSPETLVPTVRRAIRRVRREETPVAVQVPKDVLNGRLDLPEAVMASLVGADGDGDVGTGGGAVSETGRTRSAISATGEPDPAAVDEAVERFLDSDAFQPPVVLVGAGAAGDDARAAIESLAERLNAVLLTTMRGRDAFAGHPFAVGFPGNWGDPLSSEFLVEASYVLAVGCSLNEHTLDEGRLIDDDATLVHVDADPDAIGRHTPVDLGIVGDAERTVRALDAAFEREGIDRGEALWTEELRERIAAYSPLDGPEYPDAEGAMDPRELARVLDAVLPEERLVGTDGGHFRRWLLDGLTAGPADSIISCDFGAIGLGLPMGIGLGRFLEERRGAGDERTAMTFCGDAGFLMSLQELETAVRHEVPLVVVVMNDSSLGAEYHGLARAGLPPAVARVSTPDLAEVARAMGATGFQASRLVEVEAVADELARPDGPVVLECLVDPEVRHRTYR